MYKEYFGLKCMPFSIAPDPRFLYMSEGHREALAHLFYGIRNNGGFVLITGEVGTGKTTVCRCLLEQLPDTVDAAFILNPKLNSGELLASICDELGISYPENSCGIKVFVDAINAFLLDSHARGRRTVLILEEAQNLATDVLEQLRLLTNLETNERKLLQIIMIGQPELREKLAEPGLRQLSQRIIARCHLGPLTKAEVSAYIAHRTQVAGSQRTLFPASTINTLYKLSGGIPRLVNILCDRALLGAYIEERNYVDVSTLKKAAKEVFGMDTWERIFRHVKAVIVVLLSVAMFAVLAVNQLGHKVPDIAGTKLVQGHLDPIRWFRDNSHLWQSLRRINEAQYATLSGEHRLKLAGILNNTGSALSSQRKPDEQREQEER